MTQDEARMALLEILKKNIKIKKRNLIYLHLFTLAFFAISIVLAGKGIVDLRITVPLNGGIAVFYAGLLGPFLVSYSTHKNGIKRLEAGFEEDFDYIELYEKHLAAVAKEQKNK